MGNVFGKNMKVEIFGESHGAAIGAVMDGLPPGMALDLDAVKRAMKRRAPNKQAHSTKRDEKDEFEILSGLYNGKTTGTPLCTVIRNSDAKSSDYAEMREVMRPGHADYSGHVKYKGHNDVRGGGHFSGRITAPLVFCGSVARQFLFSKGIKIGAHIKSIGDTEDAPLPKEFEDALLAVEEKEFYTFSSEAAAKMQEKIAEAAKDKDSLGGVIRCAVFGAPAGLGNPFFDSMESSIAQIVFSVPAVKGIEFGAGFGIAKLRGSEANDAMYIREGKVSHRTNTGGGMAGGITNGMPIVFSAAIKPTPSIAKVQQTINIKTMEECELEIKGRHDACIVPRAVEVVKSAAAIAVMDSYIEWEKYA